MTGRPGDWSRRSCTGSAGRTRRRRPRAACSNSRCRGFGFSSRRRHTRLTCDWSSEVCSSDLAIRLAKDLEQFHLLWLEEPVPPENVAAMREVKRATTTPICAGENLYLRHGFRDLIVQQAV